MNNFITSLALLAEDSQVALNVYAMKKPHIAAMLRRRRWNIVWPAPLSEPDTLEWLVAKPEQKFVEISIERMRVGWILHNEIKYAIAVESESLHLFSVAHGLDARQNFSAVAHFQQWQNGLFVAVIGLTKIGKAQLSSYRALQAADCTSGKEVTDHGN